MLRAVKRPHDPSSCSPGWDKEIHLPSGCPSSESGLRELLTKQDGGSGGVDGDVCIAMVEEKYDE